MAYLNWNRISAPLARRSFSNWAGKRNAAAPSPAVLAAAVSNWRRLSICFITHVERNSFRSFFCGNGMNSVLLKSLGGQPALGVERGHAAAAGGGDRLAIIVVGHVAGGKHAFHARVGPGRRRSSGCTSSRSAPACPSGRPCWACGRWPGTRRSRRFSRSGSPTVLCRRTPVTPSLSLPKTSASVRFQRISIFGLPTARWAMIFDARSSSRRWTM